MRKTFATRKLAIAGAAIVLFFGAVATAVTVQPPTRRIQSLPAPTYVADEILVKFKPQVSAQYKSQAIEAYGGKQVRELSTNGYVQIKVRPGADIAQSISTYTADSSVESVQPNYIYHSLAVPNDTYYSQMWGLKNSGQTIGTPTYSTNNPGRAEQDMKLEAAWDQITDCRSIIVAVIDSGVNYTHQDLAANMWDGAGVGFPNHGFDFADNDNDPMPAPQDAHGHGTHVAGTIGAVGNNGLGMTGVCWRARIMAIRAESPTIGYTSSALMASVDFAVANGAKVINMSLGGSNFDPALEAAITNAKVNRVVVVIAAGNGGVDRIGDDNDAFPFYPCNSLQDNVICVAALDQAYSLATFSNYGLTTVDVGAPGVNTMSSWHGTTITDDFTNGWTLTGGFAAVPCDLDGIGSLPPIPMLVNPANWCSGGNYANNASDVAYKTFNLSGASQARLSFLSFLDTEPNFDFAGVAFKNTGGNPFTVGGVLDEATGTSNNMAVAGSVNLNTCNTATCSVGFGLRSDASTTNFGLSVFNFRIETVQGGSNVYKVINGTSMASPHVAGLAALIWAYSPGYTYSDVINSIKNGGDLIPALAGRTTTGRAVNAMGSLRYINPPSGVTAVKL